MPVQVAPVSLAPVPNSDTYVATIKSRRSSTMQPQVDGNLVKIFVKSGQVVKAGQVLMRIDPLKQLASVQSQQGTQAQKKALYDYNKIEVERQRKLFEAGVVSRDTYDQANQAYENSKADYESNQALTDTVDENADLEAYIYIPTERAGSIRKGLPVSIIDTAGNILVKTTVDFISPQVDNGLQSILAKASVPRTADILRNQQLVKARITWSTAPAPTVPVLAVSLIGGQTFVYVATPKGDGYIAHQIPVTVGETVGNTYPILGGLKMGEKVITSGLQFLQEGAPVKPLG